MNLPLVSVIVPLYNSAKVLEETLRSILAQTYRNIEVLLIDDGSKDETPAVARRFALEDDRVRYLPKENGGVGSARNFGIEHSQGELIALCDHDDLWDPNKLERQIPSFENPRVGLVCCGSRAMYKDDQGSVLRVSSHRRFLTENHFDRLLEKNRVPACTAVVRKECFSTVGLFNASPDMHGVDDWHMWIRIANRYEIIQVPEVLATHVFWGQNWSLRESEMLRSTLHCLGDIERILPDVRARNRRLLNVGYFETYFGFGKSFLNTNDFKNARRCFVRALSHKPYAAVLLPYIVVSWLPKSIVQLLRKRHRRPR